MQYYISNKERHSAVCLAQSSGLLSLSHFIEDASQYWEEGGGALSPERDEITYVSQINFRLFISTFHLLRLVDSQVPASNAVW